MHNYSIDKLLNRSSINSIFSIFEEEKKEIRLVGGCVRDALMSRKAQDIDIAARIEPKEIIEILNKHKIFFDDYAYNYGSIIAYIDDEKIQITSLREDINQVGRHTNIIYTNDWKKDAMRRDFTMNSIYLSRNGDLNDYFNGYKDIKLKVIRFIGNLDERVQEDYLRIYRYYRFLGIFNVPIDNDNYEFILNNYIKQSFNYLSNDIIRQEILKMFNTPYSLNCFYNIYKLNKKRKWIEIVKNHFINKQYSIGLNKCINKIDSLIN